MEQVLKDIAAQCSLVRKNNRWEGPCPECGGDKGSTRFHLRDDGGYKCWACDFKGDAIKWLRTREGMSCPEAWEAIGRNCNRHACPAWGSCRMGDGSGRGQRSTRRLPPRVSVPDQHRADLAETDATPPADLWLRWATALVDASAKALPGRADVLRYLAGRGIDAAAVTRFRLGWHGQTEHINRKSIGLSEVGSNGKKTLWVPPGLVIPIFDRQGRLHRIRIRRTSQDRQQFAPELKYVWIKGAGKAPMAIHPQGKPAGAVIVEAELDAIAVAAACPSVLVAALGTVRGGLDPQLEAALAVAPVILVALDAEPGKNGGPGAGPLAVKTWLAKYRHAKYWPVLAGKDPGDYAAQGGDLAAWIEAGLPPVHDRAPIGRLKPAEGPGGKESLPGDEAGAPVYELALADGTVVLLTDDRETWEQAANAGEIVFTRRELLRLKAAQQELDDTDGQALLARVLDAKKTFGAAYVYSGAGTR